MDPPLLLSCQPRVTCGSHVTMHYRLSLADAGMDVISTFGQGPVAVTVGSGQLAESLEVCLLGMMEGQGAIFDLAPSGAFGEWDPGRLISIPSAVLELQNEAVKTYQEGDSITYADCKGRQCTGRVRAVGQERVLVDFNHPLAGRAFQFEVKIICVL